ncbi:DUF1294 domain-containing protein [Desulforhopalus sp. 52FAK]
MNMQVGSIKKWNDDKGFGFIKPKSGGKDIFIHITEYSKAHKKPYEGLNVNYFLSSDPQGRKCAVDARPVSGHKNNGRELRQKCLSLILTVVAFCSLYLLYNLQLIPIEIIGIYLTVSVLTFVMYAKDKNAAQHNRWRTPENTLHFLSLLGGWPGASMAQGYLRHKSKKFSFRFIYWVTVILNCSVLYWVTTSDGQMWIKSILQ